MSNLYHARKDQRGNIWTKTPFFANLLYKSFSLLHGVYGRFSHISSKNHAWILETFKIPMFLRLG